MKVKVNVKSLNEIAKKMSESKSKYKKPEWNCKNMSEVKQRSEM